MDEIVDSMDLTAAEVEMILDHRAKQERKRKADEQVVALLEIAAGYGKWLIETGEGGSHSKFCNDYKGIDTTKLKDRGEAYRFITEIIQIAQTYATGQGSKIYQ